MSGGLSGQESFTVGGAMSLAFKELLRRPGHFLALALISAVLGLLVNAAAPVQTNFGDKPPTPDQLSAFATQMAWAALLMTPVQGLLTGAVTYSVISGLRGGDLSLGQAIASGVNCLVYATAAVIVTTVLVGLGLMILIVPGVIAMLYLFVCAPVAAAESAWPLRAIQRSAFLTEGSRMQIFGLLALQLLISFVLVIVLSALAPAFQEAGAPPPNVGEITPLVLVSMVVSLPVNAFFAVLPVATYYLLSVAKDGRDAEAVERVFH